MRKLIGSTVLTPPLHDPHIQYLAYPLQRRESSCSLLEEGRLQRVSGQLSTLARDQGTCESGVRATVAHVFSLCSRCLPTARPATELWRRTRSAWNTTPTEVLHDNITCGRWRQIEFHIIHANIFIYSIYNSCSSRAHVHRDKGHLWNFTLCDGRLPQQEVGASEVAALSFAQMKEDKAPFAVAHHMQFAGQSLLAAPIKRGAAPPFWGWRRCDGR